MTIEEALYSYLKGYAGLAALVSTRIYPLILPQDSTFPAVTYQRISGPRIHTMGNDPGLAYPRFQVSCWGKTYASAKAVAAQVIAALQNQRNTTWGGTGGVMVQASILESDRDLYEPDTQVYHVPVDVTIWFIEG